MTATEVLSRRALGRGEIPGRTAAWQPIEGLSAGSGDVFWTGWADGDGVFVAGDEGVIFHFDGAVWERMEVPSTLPIHALWGQRRDGLWAVGWMGLILRFDGARWRQVQGGVTTEKGRYDATPENTPLFAIDGRSDGAAWAVGDVGAEPAEPAIDDQAALDDAAEHGGVDVAATEDRCDALAAVVVELARQGRGAAGRGVTLHELDRLFLRGQ